MLNNIYGGGQLKSYSTDEQVIGTQINGKPIYQKTYTGLSVSLNPNSYTNTGITIDNIDDIIDIFAKSNNAFANIGLGDIINSKLNVLSASGDVTITYLTIQYTKTTD